MFGEFLQSSTFGLTSIVDVVGQAIGATPWEGPWIKVKAIVNLISLIIGLPSLVYVGLKLFEKYISGPKDGKEVNWTTNEVTWTGLTSFFSLTMLTPLGGAFLGSIILFFIGK